MADNSFRRSLMRMYEEQELQAMTTMSCNAETRSSTSEPQTEALMNHNICRNAARRSSTPEPQTEALMNHKIYCNAVRRSSTPEPQPEALANYNIYRNAARRSSTPEPQTEALMNHNKYCNAIRRSFTPEPQTEALMNHKMYRNIIKRSTTPETQIEPLMNHKALYPSSSYNFTGAKVSEAQLMLQSVPVDTNSGMELENRRGHQSMFMPNVSHQLLSKKSGNPIGVSPYGLSCHSNNFKSGGSSTADIVMNDEEPTEMDLTLKLAPPGFSLGNSSYDSRANDFIAGGGSNPFGVKIGQSEQELDLTLRLDLPGTSVMSSYGIGRMEEVKQADLDLNLRLSFTSFQ